MPVRVDKARHDGPAPAVDDPRAVGSARIARGDRPDVVSLDEQAKAAAQSAGLPVEQQEIREYDGRRWFGLRGRPADETEGREGRAHTGYKPASRNIRADPTGQRLHPRPAANAAAAAVRICLFAWRAGKRRNHLTTATTSNVNGCVSTMIASCGERVLAARAKSDRHNRPGDDRLASGGGVR